jgi:hypothetical protein
MAQIQTPTISAVFGPEVWQRSPREVADGLADQMLARHWHVDDLPWSSLPLFPIPEGARETRKLVRFYKSVIAVSTRAEEIAVSIARRLLIHANEEKFDVSFRRALSALLNDEASHVATMLKMETQASAAFPDIPPRPGESPLFKALMPAIETLEPAVLAIFMSSYEASVAIRSYSEQQTYEMPSILATMGLHAAEDDGRHAKILRIIAGEFLRIFKDRYGGDESGKSAEWRNRILEPFWSFWSLMPAHEYFLAGNDPRQRTHVYELVMHDVEIMNKILHFLEMSPGAQEAMRVGKIADMIPGN